MSEVISNLAKETITTWNKRIKVMQAFLDGKVIQGRAVSGSWIDEHEPKWCWGVTEYRVKPEPPRILYAVYCKDGRYYNSVQTREIGEMMVRNKNIACYGGMVVEFVEKVEQ